MAEVIDVKKEHKTVKFLKNIARSNKFLYDKEETYKIGNRNIVYKLPKPQSVDASERQFLKLFLQIYFSITFLSNLQFPLRPRYPDGHGYELVSSVRALVPQKFSVEEELMHVKHVEVKSPHVGVMWKFGRGVISSGIVLVT
ncbi:hypothetical protein TNCV_2653041 [Trichonephila clavipes]|nr:hypothetical protein TNCV_2653041 [Trichonephila clavipes]